MPDSLIQIPLWSHALLPYMNLLERPLASSAFSHFAMAGNRKCLGLQARSKYVGPQGPPKEAVALATLLEQGSLHYTPKHCNLYMVVPFILVEKAMFQLVATCIF